MQISIASASDVSGSRTGLYSWQFGAIRCQTPQFPNGAGRSNPNLNSSGSPRKQKTRRPFQIRTPLAFPAFRARSLRLTIYFQPINPLKAESLSALDPCRPYLDELRLALNSNQLEAVVVWRLPCKSGSRPHPPSRESSGFDLSKQNRMSFEKNAVTSEPGSGLSPNGAQPSRRWVCFFKRLPIRNWVRIAKSHVGLKPRAMIPS